MGIFGGVAAGEGAIAFGTSEADRIDIGKEIAFTERQQQAIQTASSLINYPLP